MTTRWIYRFESLANDTIYYDFPGYMYEWDRGQEFRLANDVAIGAHHSWDFLGEYAAPLEDAEESIRFFIANGAVMTDAELDTALDSIMQQFIRIGKGKLWTIGADSSLRWAEARAISMPRVLTASEFVNHLPVECTFRRQGFWKAENPVTGSQAITMSGQTWNINNTGLLRTDQITFRLRANTAGGFVDPKLTNNLLSEWIQSTRDSESSDSEIRYKCNNYTAEYSNDNGATYVNDYDKVSTPAGQVPFMELDPGNNTMKYEGGGTPNLNIDWEFWPQYP